MQKLIILFYLFLLYQLPFSYAQDEQEDTIMLDTITIQDEPINRINYVATNYIERAELQSTCVHDVGEYLRSIPNVSGIRRGGAAIDPVVRGYKYSQLNIVLNNGVKIEGGCPNRMDPVTAHIEVEDIENIEIIKGPFSLKYGPSFGGVINLISTTPHPYDQFEIHANALLGYETNWNGKKYHGSVFGGGKKIYFHAGGGYRNYGNYISGSREGNDTTYSSAFKKYNYTAKIGFSIHPKHEISLSYDGVHGRDVMYPALPMDEKSDDAHILAIDYTANNLGINVKSITAKVYRSDVYHVMDNSHRASYANMQMVADVNAVNTGGRAAVNLQISRHKLLTGFDFENIAKNGKRVGTMSMMNTTSTSVKNLWKNALIRNMGIFVEYGTFFSSFELNAGIRLDFNYAISGDTLQIIKDGIEYFNNPDSRFFNLSASIGITKNITPWMNVSLALGRGTRSPNMLERYIKLLAVGYDRYDYLGNPQLKPETNNEADLTFEINRENLGRFYLNFFYSYVQDYIAANLLPSSVIKPQSLGAPGVKQFYNADHILSRGFEFGFKSPDRYKFGGDLVAACTYGVIPSVTKYVVEGSEVVDAVEVTNDPLPEIPPLEATMNLYYKFLNGNLIPKFTLRAVAPQDRISQAFYELETPGFVIMNLSFLYQITPYVSLHAGVNNLLDRSYFEHLNRRIIGTDQNLFEPGRIFFVTVFVNM